MKPKQSRNEQKHLEGLYHRLLGTSLEALFSSDRGAQRWKVLYSLIKDGPATCYRLSKRTGIRYGSVHPRVCELVDLGLVVYVNKTKKTCTGCPAYLVRYVKGSLTALREGRYEKHFMKCFRMKGREHERLEEMRETLTNARMRCLGRLHVKIETEQDDDTKEIIECLKSI